MVCRKTKSSDFRKAPSPGIARHGLSHRILATPNKSDPSSDRDFYSSYRDDFGVLWGESAATDDDDGRRRRRVTSEERRALAELNLDSDADLQQIKDRYKELVKKFHPDVNGGSIKAEERLKAVNQAYGHLLSSGYT